MKVNNLPPVKITQFDQFNSVLNSLSQLRDQTQINTIERIAVTFAKNQFSLNFKTRPSLLQRICSLFYKPKQLRLGFVVEKTVNFLEAHKDYLLRTDCFLMLKKFHVSLLTIRNIHAKASPSLKKLEELIHQVQNDRQKIQQEMQQIEDLKIETDKAIKEEKNAQKDIEEKSRKIQDNYQQEVQKIHEKARSDLALFENNRVRLVEFQYEMAPTKRFDDLISRRNKLNDFTVETTISKEVVPSFLFSKLLGNSSVKTCKIPFTSIPLINLFYIFQGKTIKIQFEEFLNLYSLAIYLKQDSLCKVIKKHLEKLFSADPYAVIESMSIIFQKDFQRDKDIEELIKSYWSKIDFSNLHFTSKYVEDLIGLLNSNRASQTLLQDIPKFIEGLRRANVI